MPKFEVRNRRNQVVFQDSDIGRVAGYIASGLTLGDKERVAELAEYVRKKWIELVQTTDTIDESKPAWRDVDYRADYTRGIETAHFHVQDGQANIVIQDQKAVAVELGWAPPDNADWSSGLEQYREGQRKDLRPYLLAEGSQHVKKTMGARYTKYTPSSEVSSKYRRVKFNVPGLEEMVDNTIAEAQGEHEKTRRERSEENARQAKLSETIAKRREKVRDHIIRRATARVDRQTVQLRTLKELHAVPMAYDRGGIYTEHAAWIYHDARPATGATITKRRARAMLDTGQAFTVFRTINDSESQRERGLFFTAGIKPAKLTTGRSPPVGRIIQEAIAHMVAGRNPDGTERGS